MDLMTEYALMMSVEDLDMKEFRRGQLITVLVGLSVVIAGWLIWLTGERLFLWLT